MTGDLIPRTDIRIPVGHGDEIDAWVFLPDGPGPHPVVVMAHGIGGVKAAGLAPFAERFAAGGFAALVFDYRHWGRSSGQPRQLLSIRCQLEDYRTVLAWARAQEVFDTTRVFVWGTSFSGMHIVELAAGEAGLAGGIRLKIPPHDLRPTMDMVREAAFSSLAELVADARVLDLFAGSGAYGIEALSRGAARAIFIEKNRKLDDPEPLAPIVL